MSYVYIEILRFFIVTMFFYEARNKQKSRMSISSIAAFFKIELKNFFEIIYFLCFDNEKNETSIMHYLRTTCDRTRWSIGNRLFVHCIYSRHFLLLCYGGWRKQNESFSNIEWNVLVSNFILWYFLIITFWIQGFLHSIFCFSTSHFPLDATLTNPNFVLVSFCFSFLDEEVLLQRHCTRGPAECCGGLWSEAT